MHTMVMYVGKLWTSTESALRGGKDYRDGVPLSDPPMGLCHQILAHWRQGWFTAQESEKEVSFLEECIEKYGRWGDGTRDWCNRDKEDDV